MNDNEEDRTLRRLTAVEEAIWGRYHKHRDAGLLNKVNYLTRRVDALESAAPENSAINPDYAREKMAERPLLGVGAELMGEDVAQLRRDQQYAISLAASALEKMSHLSAHEQAELAIRTYLDWMAINAAVPVNPAGEESK